MFPLLYVLYYDVLLFTKYSSQQLAVLLRSIYLIPFPYPSTTDDSQGPCSCGIQCTSGAGEEKWVEGRSVWTNRGRADSNPSVLGKVSICDRQ